MDEKIDILQRLLTSLKSIIVLCRLLQVLEAMLTAIAARLNHEDKPKEWLCKLYRGLFIFLLAILALQTAVVFDNHQNEFAGGCMSTTAEQCAL